MSRPREDDLIARYLAPLAGPGGFALRDDAALATPQPEHDLVVTKDMLVAGVHFFADDPPDAIARKALRVNLSDLAAKGAAPRGFLLGLALPSDWTEPWLAEFVGGLGRDAAGFECPLLGGDTVATPGPLTLSITAFGEVASGGMVPRTGTRSGDLLYVTGTIGDAALGLQIRREEREDMAWIAGLEPGARDALLRRHLEPQPRLGLAEALRRYARAAMDVSDGFLGDLDKMLRLEDLGTTIEADDVPLSVASRAAIALEPRLFQTALGGGDDYELLIAVEPAQARQFEEAVADTGLALRQVGVATAETVGVRVLDSAGVVLDLGRRSFQHFA